MPRVMEGLLAVWLASFALLFLAGGIMDLRAPTKRQQWLAAGAVLFTVAFCVFGTVSVIFYA